MEASRNGGGPEESSSDGNNNEAQLPWTGVFVPDKKNCSQIRSTPSPIARSLTPPHARAHGFFLRSLSSGKPRRSALLVALPSLNPGAV